MLAHGAGPRGLELSLALSQTEARLKALEDERLALLVPTTVVRQDSLDDSMAEAIKRSIEEGKAVRVRRFSQSDEGLSFSIRDTLSGKVVTAPNGCVYVEDGSAPFVVPTFAEGSVQDLVTHCIVDEFLTKHGEKDGYLNWRRTASDGMAGTGCARAVVVQTVGDGNCLNHAGSLLLWRVHDRSLLLRTCIQRTMQSDELKPQLLTRFAAERRRCDRLVGITEPATPSQIASGWDEQLRFVQTEHTTRMRGGYLTELHTFILANVLRRPIVMLGSEEAQTAGMVGVYLPLLWDPSQCSRIPLVMLFNGAHFSCVALVDGPGERSILLGTKAGALPVRFIVADEEMMPYGTLERRYMDVTGENLGVLIVAASPRAPSGPEAAGDFVRILETTFYDMLREDAAIAGTPRSGGSAFPSGGARPSAPPGAPTAPAPGVPDFLPPAYAAVMTGGSGSSGGVARPETRVIYPVFESTPAPPVMYPYGTPGGSAPPPSGYDQYGRPFW